MPQHFADRLTRVIIDTGSRVVVGLDPDWDKLPAVLKQRALEQVSTPLGAQVWAIHEFCDSIIRATREASCAFKPQIAFFERYGGQGLLVLQQLLADYPDELFIVDCKRGDIGNTTAAYAKAYFHLAGEERAPLNCAAVTHNPWQGRDSIEPYFPYLAVDRGMFLLVKTSNPSSADIQDLDTGGQAVFEHVARKVDEWGSEFIGDSGWSALGLVAGATYPEQAQRIRALAPRSYILVPGIDSQGGRLEDARAFTDENGHGAIYNFARAVIFAQASDKFASPDPVDYAGAAQRAAEHYRDRLNDVLGVPE